jgi:cellulose synthase/poly-beta-1,6-N-acetylglucosamine synthase-like glycosyltransferase
MRCAATARPIQARYSMLTSSADPADKILQFAWIVKTLARPLGSARLGWPCQLMGSGMAVPFETIRRIDLANGHLAEDQKLGAELALAGALPLFFPQAHVISRFPSSERGKHQQRARWEHGHLAIIGEYCPALIGHAIVKRSFQLFAFTLDLCIPPLSLLVLSLALAGSIALAWLVATGSVVPLAICSLALACLCVSLGAAWWRFGRELVSLRELAAIPGYCLLKIPSFIRFFVNRQIDWVRTER